MPDGGSGTTPDAASHRSSTPANHVYYFGVGRGAWRGEFSFQMLDWRAFWRDRIGLKHRFLTLAMALVQRLLGSATIVSQVDAFPSWGPNGVATNVVRIRKLGVTLYLLREQYVLDPDGSRVFVHSRERYGPIPFLFRAKKRHPAVIKDEGRRATYLDMPLLGTLWEGRYAVLDDDHIDAELRCPWGLAKEVIARSAPRPDARPSAPPRQPPASFDDVVNRLRSYREWYDAVRDPRAVFTHAYMTITERFRDQLPASGFEDPSWIIALDLAFAREYEMALDAYDLGDNVPGAWRVVFEAMEQGRTSVAEELVLAMAAHIVRDLPLALGTAGMRRSADSRIHDFHKANDVLEGAINRIQRAVSRRYNPWLGWLDRLGARHDEILTNFGIRLSRAAAWFNAERLANPTTAAAARQSLDRSVEVLVAQVLRPPLLSLRIGLVWLRWMSRLTRTWPKAGGTAPLPTHGPQR
jgi:hypothetical protein